MDPQQNNPQQPYGYPPQPPYQPSQETQPLPQQPYGYPPQLPNQGQQPYQPDTPQQPYTPNPPQQPPQKGKGGIIAAAIIGFLLVAGGVGAALYFLNKDKEPAKTGLSDTLKQKKASESVGEGDLVIDEGTTASGGAEASGEQPTAGETVAANGDDLEALERRLSQFEYTSYENDRFGYRVNIPNFMAPGPEPQNGGGYDKPNGNGKENSEDRGNEHGRREGNAERNAGIGSGRKEMGWFGAGCGVSAPAGTGEAGILRDGRDGAGLRGGHFSGRKRCSMAPGENPDERRNHTGFDCTC